MTQQLEPYRIRWGETVIRISEHPYVNNNAMNLSMAEGLPLLIKVSASGMPQLQVRVCRCICGVRVMCAYMLFCT